MKDPLLIFKIVYRPIHQNTRINRWQVNMCSSMFMLINLDTITKFLKTVPLLLHNR